MNKTNVNSENRLTAGAQTEFEKMMKKYEKMYNSIRSWKDANDIMFHITPRENVESIKKYGLNTSEDGYLYLFEGYDVERPQYINGKLVNVVVGLDKHIAQCEVFTDEYTLIAVRVKNKSDLKRDFNDGFLSTGCLYKWKYPHTISPDDILAYEDRKVENVFSFS